MVSSVLSELSAVQVLSVKVPARVKSGERVSLSCLFDLKGNSLYSLNWWKDNQQFYQFSPGSSFKQTIYETPGIDVVRTESSMKVVMLRNVTQKTSGEFKCEIVADFPTYERDARTAPMQVVDVPSSPPRISVERIHYRVGDLLEANCTSEGSDPPPTLVWLINGQKIKPKYSRVIFNHHNGVTNNVHNEIESSSQDAKKDTLDEAKKEGSQRFEPVVSEVFLIMKPIHFMHGGRATLTCVATIPHLYNRPTNIQLTLPGISPVEPSQRVSGSSTKYGLSFMVKIFLITFNVKIITVNIDLKYKS